MILILNTILHQVKTSQKCQPLSHLPTHFPLTPHLTTIQAILREEIHMIQEHLQVHCSINFYNIAKILSVTL